MSLKEKYALFPPFTQVIILLIIGLVLFSFVSGVATLTVQTFFPSVPIDNIQLLVDGFPVFYMLLYFIPFQLGFLFLPGLYFFYVLSTKREISNQTLTSSNFTWALLLFTAVFFLLPFLNELNEKITSFFGVYEELQVQKQLSDEQLISLFGPSSSTTSYIVALLTIGLLTGIAEEFFFRGFLFKHLLHTTNKTGFSIILSALIFALLHFNYVQFIPLLAFGVALGLMYHVSGSLMPGIIAHVVNNMLNVYWVHTDSFPNWMDELWVEITIPSIIILMGLLYFKKNVF